MCRIFFCQYPETPVSFLLTNSYNILKREFQEYRYFVSPIAFFKQKENYFNPDFKKNKVFLKSAAKVNRMKGYTKRNLYTICK